MSTYLHDMQTNNGLKNSLAPATRTASANGSSGDFIDGEGQCYAVSHVGTVSGTTPTLDAKIQESDDNSTWTDITGATFTQVTASTALQVISFLRTKRYLRGVATIAGTSPSFAHSLLIGQQPKVLPTS